MTESESAGGTERFSRYEVLAIIREVESEVVAESKLGATRDDVVRGTCQRIRRRLREEGTEADR